MIQNKKALTCECTYAWKLTNFPTEHETPNIYNPISSRSNDNSKGKGVDDKVVGSRNIGCMCNLPI